MVIYRAMWRNAHRDNGSLRGLKIKCEEAAHANTVADLQGRRNVTNGARYLISLVMASEKLGFMVRTSALKSLRTYYLTQKYTKPIRRIIKELDTLLAKG